VLMDVGGHAFRAMGRIPLKAGWKAVYGLGEPEGGGGRGGDDGDAEQVLPPLADGEVARLGGARVEAKRTQAPPRYNEGTLIDAMQNAWRFVEDPVQRERLKDAKGVGTPATRAAIIEGLKRQGLLVLSGKWIVPTEAGLELYILLSEAAPLLVDPGTTALWELRLDGIVQHASDVIQVVDEIAAETDRLIQVLKQQGGRAIALLSGSIPAARAKEESGRRHRTRLPPGRKPDNRCVAQADAGTAPGETGPVRQAAGFKSRTPTKKMISFARSLARARKVSLPEGHRSLPGGARAGRSPVLGVELAATLDVVVLREVRALAGAIIVNDGSHPPAGRARVCRRGHAARISDQRRGAVPGRWARSLRSKSAGCQGRLMSMRSPRRGYPFSSK
jgi:DNA topoisomerase III